MNGKDRIFLIVVHDQTCDADCTKLQKDMASLGPILAQLDRAAICLRPVTDKMTIDLFLDRFRLNHLNCSSYLFYNPTL